MTARSRNAIGLLLLASTFGLGCSSSDNVPPAVAPDASLDAVAVEDRSAVADVASDRGVPVEANAEAEASVAPTDGGSVDSDGAASVADAPVDSPCSGCDGACLDTGVCVGCIVDQHCAGATPRCDLARNLCVACLPGTTDNCPAGQYCTGAFTCVPGCKGNSSCASGACNANHECERCQSDLECSGGHVCGTGTCGPRCNAPSDCTGGYDCCDSHCVDPKRDVRHCGDCATSCPSAQFCGTGGASGTCTGVTIANVCANAKTTRILDDFDLDNAAGQILQDGITANCSPAPSASSIAQNAAGGPLNATTGQPVAGGGDLLTVAGGYVVQKVVAYLDSIGATPVYAVPVAEQWEYRSRGSTTDAGALVGVIRFDEVTLMHDYILVEVVRDPASGTLLLIVFGVEPESTTAGAYHVAKHMLPNRATFDKAWYLFSWTGTGDAGPSDSDTFQIVASGF